MSTGPRNQKARHYSSPEKRDAVLRLLKGENSGAVAQDIGVGVNRLERWQATFLNGGLTALENKRAPRPTLFKTLKTHGAAISQWAVLLVVLTIAVFFLVRFLS